MLQPLAVRDSWIGAPILLLGEMHGLDRHFALKWQVMGQMHYALDSYSDCLIASKAWLRNVLNRLSSFSGILMSPACSLSA